MPRARKHASLMTSTPDEIEQAFYEALQHADLERMMDCWSDDDEVICIHPDGQRLAGHAVIRGAFEQLFAGAKTMAVKPQNVLKSSALDCAVHSVIEAVQVKAENGEFTAYINATNVYHRTAKGWRMVMHHASPASPTTEIESHTPPQTLH